MKNRFRGAFLGLALGDAIGFPAEFVHDRKGIDVKGPPTPAMYSDDTQMTVCLANALIESNETVPEFMKALSKQFVAWLSIQDNPALRRAPGNTCLAACRRLAKGVHWEQSGVPDSLGCGSAMRSAPIGLFFDRLEKVVDYAINSSRITHPHELAMCATAGTAVLTHLALTDVPVGVWPNELLQVAGFNPVFAAYVRRAAKEAALGTDPDIALSAESLGEGWTGHEAVASALFCCLVRPHSYKDAVLLAANTVGDSDSIACITGALMGAKLGVEAIPPEWVEQIEDGTGLTDLADRMYAKSPWSHNHWRKP